MATNGKLILVTGATGHQGGAALRHLRAAGFRIRAITRHPDSPKAKALNGLGVEVVHGDLHDSGLLHAVLDGVDGVYSVQNWQEGAQSEIEQGKNLIDAAKQAGVNHLVYSSVGSADKNTGIPHFDSKYQIEQHLLASGIPYTIVRPVFFMENWLGMKDQIEQGQLALPLRPETRFQMIAVDDIGAFVTSAFEDSGKYQARVIEIAGADLSMTEIAADFSKAADRPVEYKQLPWDQFEQHMGHELAIMWKWFQEVGYHIDVSALRRERPSLISFEQWLQSHWRA
jgi:uncharacterized protein YbjT (DUF2867 family)